MDTVAVAVAAAQVRVVGIAAGVAAAVGATELTTAAGYVRRQRSRIGCGAARAVVRGAAVGVRIRISDLRRDGVGVRGRRRRTGRVRPRGTAALARAAHAVRGAIGVAGVATVGGSRDDRICLRRRFR